MRLTHRTKIVATIGPASSSAEMIRRMIAAGMNVARLNFSHGSYDDHAKVVSLLREISAELEVPLALLQDLQGPKIRVGTLEAGAIELRAGQQVRLVPQEDDDGKPGAIPIDYPDAAEEARAGMQVLLADGLFELRVVAVVDRALHCEVVQGGLLKSRKGVNFPNLKLNLPSLTEKDRRDLEFGLDQGVDWVSLSFVRSAEDIRALRRVIEARGLSKPVIAKIEKPQAVEHLEEILDEANGVMVARGDLGVELAAERVPMVQKHIIEACNRRGMPVITATQMLESMITEARATRAETSDVANAIIDGTDAVMLSGESAVGAYPVQSIETMVRIAREVESQITFKTYPPHGSESERALVEAVKAISHVLKLKAIVVFTTKGHTARFVAAQRPEPPVVAVTTDAEVCHALNLVWGIRPLLLPTVPTSFENLIDLAEATLRDRAELTAGDQVLVIGGIPVGTPYGSNFLKIHTVA